MKDYKQKVTKDLRNNSQKWHSKTRNNSQKCTLKTRNNSQKQRIIPIFLSFRIFYVPLHHVVKEKEECNI